MNYFIFSPGKVRISSGTVDGGDGGVLVNGENPDDVKEYHGEGFGGGGQRETGFPSCVHIEINV